METVSAEAQVVVVELSDRTSELKIQLSPTMSAFVRISLSSVDPRVGLTQEKRNQSTD